MEYLNKLISLRFSLIKLVLSSKSLSKQSYEDLKMNLKLTNTLINNFKENKSISEIGVKNIENYLTNTKTR